MPTLEEHLSAKRLSRELSRPLTDKERRKAMDSYQKESRDLMMRQADRMLAEVLKGEGMAPDKRCKRCVAGRVGYTKVQGGMRAITCDCIKKRPAQ